MRVICDAPGQTCNRLWSYVAIISECIVKEKKMVILFYDCTIEEFPNLKNCSFIYFPLYWKWLLEIGRNWGRFRHFTWILTHNKVWDKIFNTLGFEKGWYTRKETKYIAEAKDKLIEIFTPDKLIVEKAETFFSEIRKNANIIIGVHIRRGDYVTWNEGRFYYSFSEYINFMNQVERLYLGQNVVFFISSNEKINADIFKGFSCYYYEKENSAVLDLYSLSLCDKIIGPFSTFSRWSSFIGEKPICFLESKDQVINEQSFSVIIDYFHFADGREIADW